MHYPLGKKDFVKSDKDILFASLRNPLGLNINVPNVFGHGNTFANWGLNGNDKFGCCVEAGGAHETELINNLAAGGVTGKEVVKITTENTLSDYAAITGFNPATGENDNGTEVRAALEYRVKTGLIDSTGKRHKIGAFVFIEPGSIQHLIEAIFIFDAVGIGIKFPGSAMEQFNNGQPWSVVPGSNIEGGHYVPLVGKPAQGDLACITWGKRQVLTEAFYKEYCDEAWAYVTPESLNTKTLRNWGGFNWNQLQEDLQNV